MSKDREWDLCGRYGDDEESISIVTMPDELSEDIKRAMKLLYQRKAVEFFDHDISMDVGYQIQKLGLARQVGNAWNHQIMWAPQVHAWMNGVDNNRMIAQGLCNQYVT